MLCIVYHKSIIFSTFDISFTQELLVELILLNCFMHPRLTYFLSPFFDFLFVCFKTMTNRHICIGFLSAINGNLPVLLLYRVGGNCFKPSFGYISHVLCFKKWMPLSVSNKAQPECSMACLVALSCLPDLIDTNFEVIAHVLTGNPFLGER